MKKLSRIIVFCAVAFALVLTGCQKEKVWSVAFNSQGGSAVSTIENVADGTKITKPTDPAKEGFVFAGWHKEAACQTAWNFASDVVNNNITLYAKWTTPNPNPEGNYSAEETEATTLNLSGTGVYQRGGVNYNYYTIEISNELTSLNNFFFAFLIVYTNNASIEGTYQIDFSKTAGTCLASAGGDSNNDYPSSVMIITNGSYEKSYYLISGTVTLTATSANIVATTYYGSTINITASLTENVVPTGLQAEGTYWGDYYENGTENYTLEI
jgi:uncharacterized repeat protein (TIGR02543 family)